MELRLRNYVERNLGDNSLVYFGVMLGSRERGCRYFVNMDEGFIEIY